MAATKYIISLTPKQRGKLDIVSWSYRHSARERDRAKVLLLADTGPDGKGLKDAAIAESVGCTALTVSQVWQRASVRGVLEPVGHKEQSKRRERRLDGAGEAQLVTLACSQAPDGRKRWTMQLLKERLIQMQVVASIDEATICRTLKKTRLSPG